MLRGYFIVFIKCKCHPFCGLRLLGADLFRLQPSQEFYFVTFKNQAFKDLAVHITMTWKSEE